MKKNIKQILISLFVIVLAFVGFRMFFVDDSPADTSLSVDAESVSYIVDGPAILALLNRMNQINLDSSVFSNKVFTSLTSFERPLLEQVPGRPNPFLPIGTDSSAGISTVGTSTIIVR